MKDRYTQKSRYYFLAIFLLFIALILVVCSNLEVKLGGEKMQLADFSEAWSVNGETCVDAADLKAKKFGGSFKAEKALPQKIGSNDSLCFTTANLRFSVEIGDEEIYSYDTVKNLTGMGYGIDFHMINLSPDQAGKIVRIDAATVFANKRGGHLYRPQIGTEKAFVSEICSKHILGVIFAFVPVVIAIAIFVLLIVFPKKEFLHCDMLALALFSLVAGIWTINDTGILRVIMGSPIVARELDHALMHFPLLPLTLFLSSITRERKLIFIRAEAVLTVLDMGFFLVWRFVLGRDMAWITGVMAAYYFLSFALIGAMLYSDRRYCRKNRINVELRLVYIAAGVLGVSLILDIIVYMLTHTFRVTDSRAIFQPYGFAIFSILIATQMIRWWIIEKTSLGRDRFVNKALQYAISAGDPESSIASILEYIGSELGAKRAYIYENREDGTYYNTYEWFAPGKRPRMPEYRTLPVAGLIDELFEVFKMNGRLIISDREADKDLNEILYRVLTANDVTRMVVGPLEAEGRLIGLFGVDDAPAESLREISEITRLIAYILAQLILHREDQKKLIRYSYFDAMTGCRNRRALKEFETGELEKDRAFGIVTCDLNGLKQINDTLGHDEGDKMILDTAEILKDIFGDENVYRMGGDEFLAYFLLDDESLFQSDVESLKERLIEKKRSAAIGAMFWPYGEEDVRKAKVQVDTLMYEDKREFYEKRADLDRRRRSRQE